MQDELSLVELAKCLERQVVIGSCGHRNVARAAILLKRFRVEDLMAQPAGGNSVSEGAERWVGIPQVDQLSDRRPRVGCQDGHIKVAETRLLCALRKRSRAVRVGEVVE